MVRSKLPDAGRRLNKDAVGESDYLGPTFFIDCDQSIIRDTSRKLIAATDSILEQARYIFYFVRDDIRYNVYSSRASDNDFNRKSFTTGHTGFGIPFATWPDRVDVPRNAARSLRYMDEYQLVTQGEVFYITELLTKLEGMERGPAGNTSLTAAVTMARQMDKDQVIVVQETEYTGAGKHQNSQLSFARENGIEIRRGNPVDDVPGKTIIIPERLEQVQGKVQDIDRLRVEYLHNAGRQLTPVSWTDNDVKFLAQDIKKTPEWIRKHFLPTPAS